MDVLVVECVLHVAVQVTYVRVGLDGEFLLDVLCPDEFTPLLPTRKQPKKKEKGSRVEPHGARTRGDPFLYIVCICYIVLCRFGLEMCNVASIISLKLWLDMCRAMSSCDVGT